VSKEILSLKDLYKDYFKIGAAVNPSNLAEDADILATHFNSLTAENHMKPEEVQPEKGNFTFETADSFVQFAKENNQEMRGHTLVWHNQTPKWMFEDEKGKPLTREVALSQLKEHITAVLTHFKDPFYSWDVVNEAIADSGEDQLRDSPWLQVIGEDYLDKAFEYAREVDSSVSLYYNDYNESQPEKREKIYSLVKGLKERGAPIDGVGMQAHWGLEDPTLDEIRQAIERYASLGLKVQITEMDVSVFAFGDKRTDLLEPTSEMMEKQAERYGQFFKIFREYHKEIEAVTLWGVSDRYTWLSDFPVAGRKNWPLLFDANNQPKEAFYRITDF
jgi:endo-1,4-beta-xylanase